MSIPQTRKALVSALVAGVLGGLAAAQQVVPDGITPAEWLGIAVAALTAAVGGHQAVYWTRNAPKGGE